MNEAHLTSLLQLAIDSHNSGQLIPAKHYYREILRIAPQNHIFWSSYLELLAITDQMDEYWHQLSEAARILSPETTRTLAVKYAMHFSSTAIKNKDWRSVRSATEKGLKYAPDNSQLLHQLGIALLQDGKLDSSVKVLHKAVNSVSDPEIHNSFGVALMHAGQHQDARLQFYKALSFNSEFDIALYNTAYNDLQDYEYESATSFAQQALAINPDYEKAHFVLGCSQLKMGKLELACQHLQTAIRSALTSCHSWLLPTPTPITQSHALHALLDAKTCLDNAGIPFFLCAGTLLGIIRDGDILKHDKDMDIGLWSETDRQQAADALIKSGVFTINNPKLSSHKHWQWNFSVAHLPTQTGLDLFFYHPKGNFFLSGFYHEPTPVISQPRRFSLTTHAWKGKAWNIPEHPELYLEDVYGPDWRQPDKFFDTTISNRSQTSESTPVRRLLGYTKLYDALIKQHWTKAHSYCSQILFFSHDVFIENIKLWLESNQNIIQKTPIHAISR